MMYIHKMFFYFAMNVLQIIFYKRHKAITSIQKFSQPAGSSMTTLTDTERTTIRKISRISLMLSWLSRPFFKTNDIQTTHLQVNHQAAIVKEMQLHAI